MATTTNYTKSGATRKVDLYVMGRFDHSSGERQLTQPSISVPSGGFVCAGIVKLAQKIIITILSVRVAYDPEWGTVLTHLVLSGGNNNGTIQENFAYVMSDALDKTKAALKQEENPLTQLDERISELLLEDWRFFNGRTGISVVISLTTMSNETVEIVVPISIAP